MKLLAVVPLLGAVLSAVAADSVVVFNEIHYHSPANDPASEWVELHNQMAVDIDLSVWAITGGIAYTFPEGTIIPGGGYLVVAADPAAIRTQTGLTNVVGPFAGRLANDGELVELRDRNNRLMDAVDYRDDGDWPIAPDGSGTTLAKRNPNANSAPPENWTSSVIVGGTPGRRNFPEAGGSARSQVLVPWDAVWRYETNGTDLGEGWREPGFDDRAWPGVNAARLLSYWPFNGGAVATVGANGTLVGAVQSVSDRNTNAASALSFIGTAQQYVSVPGGGGLDGASSATISLWVKWTGNQDADCCGSFGPILARQANGQFSENVLALSAGNPLGARIVWRQSATLVAITSRSVIGTNWHHIAVTMADGTCSLYIDGQLEGTGTGPGFSSAPNIPLAIGAWNGDGTGFSTSTIDDVAIWDRPLTLEQISDLAAGRKTPLDFRFPERAGYFAGNAHLPESEQLLGTELPLGAITYYFRQTFLFGGDPAAASLKLSHAVDDGALFYLNGLELQRFNMPPGPPSASTLAASPIQDATILSDLDVPAGALRLGTNILAAEVHQSAADNDPDMFFAAELRSITAPAPAIATFPADGGEIVLNEVSAGGVNPFSVEIYNRGSNSVALGGMALTRTGATAREYVFPALNLPPGQWLELNQAQLGFGGAIGDHLFLYGANKAWVADALEISDRIRCRVPDGVGSWLNAQAATPGMANLVNLHGEVVLNEICYHAPAALEQPAVLNTNVHVSLTNFWQYEQSGNDPGESWFTPGFPDQAWPSGRGLFYFTATTLPAPKSTQLTLGPATYYFRTSFDYTPSADVRSFVLRYVVDDGAVFYLNGAEIFRVNMRSGSVSNLTFAATNVANPTLSAGILLPLTNLLAGANVLAVEVHQFSPSGNDVVFGAELSTVSELAPRIPFAPSNAQWIELFNRSSNAVNLTGWRFDKGIEFAFANNTVIGPGGFLVVANEPAALREKYPLINVVGPFTRSLSHQGELLVLADAAGNPADSVHYFDDGRWPMAPDGGGASLELRHPFADNAIAENWAASDERARSSWQTYSYRGIAQSSTVGPDGQWREFVLGLLGPGEVWLDDISVVESPAGASPVELIQNGTFDTSTNKWRIIGNHHGSVIDDPDQPGNKVLRLISRGETEHMSNHAETTLAGGRDVVNGREYRISFRARWIYGCRQFLTRLYFNRLARITLLPARDLLGTPGTINSTFTTNLGPAFYEFRHEPAVPASYEPVKVFAQVNDPDGLGADPQILFSIQGGSRWRTNRMTDLGNGRFQGLIPGQGAGVLVQFYVAAEDGLGNPSTFPPAGPASRALFKVDDGRAATNGLHNLRLLLTPNDADQLHRTVNLMSNDPLGCTAIYDEREIVYDAGIRLKGSEHSRTATPRLGFDLDLPSAQKFRGIHRTLGIDRSESVGFGQREMLIHQTLNHAGGLPTKYHDLVQILPPRLEHTGSAELQLARYTDVFLADQFPNGSDGTVFEYELVYQLNTTDTGTPEGNKVPAPDSVTGTPIRNLGNDKEGYRWTFLIKNNEERDDYNQMIQFSKAMDLNGNPFFNQITNLIDLDQWLRAYAVCVLSGAGDNFGGDGSQHNVRFYVRPTDQKLMFLPHDVDAFFDVTRPLVGSGELTKFISQGIYARAYYRHVREIINTTYNGTYMTRWASHYGRLLPQQDFAGHLAFLIQRSTSLLSQINAIAGNTPFAITSNSGRDFLAVGVNTAITGTANLGVKEIFLAGNTNPLPVAWSGASGWSATIPLQLGTNLLVFNAYNDAGQLVGTDSITVTATQAGGVPDSDGDGMPDAWESAHNLDPKVPGANQDSDGDGITNYGEFLAGTDPQDRQSRPDVKIVPTADGRFVVIFTAVAGRSYSLDGRNDLTEGKWFRLLNATPQLTNRVVQFTLPPTEISAQGFFRLLTPMAP